MSDPNNDAMPKDARDGQDDGVVNEIRVTPRFYEGEPFGLYEVLGALSPKKRNVFARELMTLGLVFWQQKYASSGSPMAGVHTGHVMAGSTLTTTTKRKPAKRREVPAVATAAAAREAKDGAVAFASLFGDALTAMTGEEVAAA